MTRATTTGTCPVCGSAGTIIVNSGWCEPCHTDAEWEPPCPDGDPPQEDGEWRM